MSELTREGPNPSSENKLSGANGDREKNIFPVQLTKSRIGNHTRLLYILLKYLTIHEGYRPCSGGTLGRERHWYVIAWPDGKVGRRRGKEEESRE